MSEIVVEEGTVLNTSTFVLGVYRVVLDHVEARIADSARSFRTVRAFIAGILLEICVVEARLEF